MRGRKKRRGTPLRYHLRFQIAPAGDVERDARVLARFCIRHGVEEVALFLSVGDWSNGPLTLREQRTWLDAMEKAKEVLEEAGVTVSLNIWITVGHGDGGRRFSRGQTFIPMMSPTGQVSKSCASFADPMWRRYIRQLYGRFAKLGFRVIWVDDDFRYHNHAPLTWGGGFEAEIVDRFGARIGRQVTRQEVVEKVLRPGEPHPWRAKWMETWREIQEEFAADLAQAVAKSSPCAAKMGLMSSNPAVHSIEGRNWQRLFEAFSIDGQVAHRPNFAPYRESVGNEKTSSILMLDMQRNLRPANCEVAPEIENHTYTRWAKSDSMTWSEMALAMFFGADSLLLELLPISGNCVDEDREIGALLDRSRPALEWISVRFSKDLRTQGVGVPWKPDAAEHMRTTTGRSMTELQASFLEPARFLLPYGIPVSANRQPVNAVFGNLAWTFNEDEMYRMLGGGLLLDGVSAQILCERGFGKHVGVKAIRQVGREDSAYAMERITSERTGLRKALRFSLHNLRGISILEPIRKADEWTTVVAPTLKRLGAGIVAHENRLGGRVVTYAAHDLSACSSAAAPPAALAPSDHRQKIAQKAVEFLYRGRFPSVMVTGGPHLHPIHFEGRDKQYVVVFNGSPDPAKPVLRMGSISAPSKRAIVLRPLVRPVKADVAAVCGKDHVVVACKREIPYLGFLVVEW